MECSHYHALNASAIVFVLCPSRDLGGPGYYFGGLDVDLDMGVWFLDF